MFEQMESDYAKQWKRSDHRLRRMEREESSMEGYEASEEERKEKTEPVGQLLMKGSDRRFSAGYNREGRLTMVFSRDKNDGKRKDEETFRKEGSAVSKRNRKYLRTGTHRPEKGAQALEDRESKRKKYLLGQVKKAMDGPEKSLLDEAFPFLSTKEEKERIRMLEDDARRYSKEPETVETERKEAEMLGRDVAHKEEEKKDLLKKLAAQVTVENMEKKRKRWTPEKRMTMDMMTELSDDDGNGAGGENGTAAENDRKMGTGREDGKY